MKMLFYIYLLTTFSISAFAQSQASPTLQQAEKSSTIKAETQNPCALEIAQMPLISGLKLGMSYEEVKEGYPEIESNEHFQKTYIKIKEGLAMFSNSEISNPENKKFVEQISLNIQAEKLNTVNTIYNSKAAWKSLNEMIEGLSETLGVDKNYWEIINEHSAQLKCKDFEMYSNYLTTEPNKPNVSMTFGSGL
ncbi:hypothetical protein BH18ACI1_BH18ACI1_12470 [soil metagenome]